MPRAVKIAQQDWIAGLSTADLGLGQGGRGSRAENHRLRLLTQSGTVLGGPHHLEKAATAAKTDISQVCA
jgi:hypothetical protein